MIEGTLIGESLRVGTTLEAIPLSVRRITRADAALSPDQIAAGLPSRWTIIEFQAEDRLAEPLAEVLARSLEPVGWYVNFQSPGKMFVVFPGRIFRYRRSDEAARAKAQAYGRSLGIPEPQLDCTK